MNHKSIAIATLTWARDDQEEALLRESLTQLSTLNIPVYITDGGSKESFLAFLRGFPHFTLLSPPTRGVWQQARNSLSAAYQAGSPFIFYTEPDKAGFFSQFLAPWLRGLFVDEQTGVVLACRSAGGFATFPPFQQMTETTINHCCAEVIGEPVDYVYGPFLLNRNLIPYLKNADPAIGWGWRPYAFNVARRLGYRVEAVTGDFYCPIAQRQDTPAERIYRMRQLTQNVEGLTLSTSVALE